MTVLLQFFLGLVLALALNKPFRGRNIYQAIVFLPWSISALVIGFTFRWLYNAEFGPANATHTLASYMFSKAYSTLDFGQTGALGVLFMAGLLLYAGAFMKLTKYDGSGGF